MAITSKQVPQASVHYRDAGPGDPVRCGNCTMFIFPGGCTHVLPFPRRIYAGGNCDDQQMLAQTPNQAKGYWHPR